MFLIRRMFGIFIIVDSCSSFGISASYVGVVVYGSMGETVRLCDTRRRRRRRRRHRHRRFHSRRRRKLIVIKKRRGDFPGEGVWYQPFWGWGGGERAIAREPGGGFLPPHTNFQPLTQKNPQKSGRKKVFFSFFRVCLVAFYYSRKVYYYCRELPIVYNAWAMALGMGNEASDSDYALFLSPFLLSSAHLFLSLLLLLFRWVARLQFCCCNFNISAKNMSKKIQKR